MFNYSWKISDGYNVDGIQKHGLKVFGTFICGGGSSMGYKLAGYDHLGGVEIDQRMASIYKKNHNPKYLYCQDIRDFRLRNDVPEELYNLDILDGSPPCSSFSMVGSREKGWGKNKKFREGQSDQTLDDLFFEYIALAEKLKPKVVIAENVKGMLAGNAKSYVRKIKKEFESAGYVVQLFLLDASTMEVPQRRERIFFVCHRKDLEFPKLSLNFKFKKIPFRIIDDGNVDRFLASNSSIKYAKNTTSTGICQTNKKSIKGKLGGVGFCSVCISDAVPLTIISGGEVLYKDKKNLASKGELCKIGTFPLDYNFMGEKPQYVIGMSVPPVMMAQVSNQIYLQWFLNNNFTHRKAGQTCMTNPTTEKKT